jgi:DNA-binding MarR family transcriptional regulator
VSTDSADAAPDERDFARALDEAFQRVYLQFHRREGKRAGISAASRSVLMHLAHTGPLTIGEMSGHLDRAQSVVSDIVTQLERKDLLARERDPADRRRTLVWLTPGGFEILARERQVLSIDLISRAASAMSPQRRAAVLQGLEELLSARVDPQPRTNRQSDGSSR